jgi:hypothetical protein
MNIFQIKPIFLLLFFKQENYVAIATMIICVKHFVNIPDVFLMLTSKIIINKMGN